MNLKLVTLSAAVVLVAACGTTKESKIAEKTPGEAAASIEAKELAAENEAPVVIEIEFDKGRSDLTTTSKTNIDQALKRASTRGKLDEVKVVSWADQEYPSTNAGDLPKKQKDLADARNKKINDYLEARADKLDVDTYSMAERPGALARLLSTEDARVKRSLETAGIPNTDSSVKMPSKASKAIVMFILEDNK